MLSYEDHIRHVVIVIEDEEGIFIDKSDDTIEHFKAFIEKDYYRITTGCNKIVKKKDKVYLYTRDLSFKSIVLKEHKYAYDHGFFLEVLGALSNQTV